MASYTSGSGRPSHLKIEISGEYDDIMKHYCQLLQLQVSRSIITKTKGEECDVSSHSQRTSVHIQAILSGHQFANITNCMFWAMAHQHPEAKTDP